MKINFSFHCITQIAILQKTYNHQDENIIDADEDDQLAAAIQASLTESQKSASDACVDAIKRRITDTYTDTPSDSDLEIYSGDESNLSTPVKITKSKPVNNDTEREAECISVVKGKFWRRATLVPVTLDDKIIR